MKKKTGKTDLYIVSRANRDWGFHYTVCNFREYAERHKKAWKAQGFSRVRIHKVSLRV